MNTYRIYLSNGETKDIKGESIIQAFKNAGQWGRKMMLVKRWELIKEEAETKQE